MRRRSSSDREGGRLAWVLLPLLVSPVLLAALPGGCETSVREVDVEQPVAFGHGAHLAYFRSGEHRKQMIGMHLEALELDPEDAPVEMFGCTTCHAIEQNRQCMGCHEILLDQDLRAREEIRPCATCHRGVWSGNDATLPGNEVCDSCHVEAAELVFSEDHVPSSAEESLLAYVRGGDELPWIQLHTTPDHVHFSHFSHVRFAGMACQDCHEDVSDLLAPVTRVVVFSMNGCVGCHEQQGASVDCLICHQ